MSVLEDAIGATALSALVTSAILYFPQLKKQFLINNHLANKTIADIKSSNERRIEREEELAEIIHQQNIAKEQAKLVQSETAARLIMDAALKNPKALLPSDSILKLSGSRTPSPEGYTEVSEGTYVPHGQEGYFRDLHAKYAGFSPVVQPAPEPSEDID